MIFKAFFGLCRLQNKPQDLPTSIEFLFICLVIYTIVSFFVSLSLMSFADAAISGGIDTSLVMLMTYCFLYIRRVSERWVQTTTALAGTGIIFNLLVAPIYYWIAFVSSKEPGYTAVALLILVILFWSIIVMGHIMRYAMSIPFAAGILVSFVYLFIISNTIAMFTSPISF